MTDLSEKLQLGDRGMRVINAPEGMVLDLPAATGPNDGVLVFARTRAELDAHAEPALSAARADRLAWIAYPKAGQLDTDLSRDRLWDALEGRGVRPVRQIAIDGVWSALRFRPA
ncbi:MAG: hypothetical protein GWM90_28315 [Gemmatimonadetes bacterium]|nr:hypothetical protein [Gemmatimonadota bacterium]NIQ58939.1 hypothetical protein [Gemmatimonadota bacterium]NIU79129.1 hypothetical protein [Gammaproteobacteria bacterium]NIX47833.1 hypothetical protein [Gemmatimonadota bacterium]NIY12198.1 hypothetical protein [Gemmatimonadota bacterium]